MVIGEIVQIATDTSMPPHTFDSSFKCCSTTLNNPSYAMAMPEAFRLYQTIVGAMVVLVSQTVCVGRGVWRRVVATEALYEHEVNNVSVDAAI